MISVSYLKSKYNKYDTLKMINESNADYIHVDLMDGIYVQNKNFTILDLLNDLSLTTKPLDVHLMVDNPIQYIDDLVKFNVKIITFHLDSTNNPLEVINKIKENNIKVGIAINPNEDISILNDYYDLIDYVLIMSVYPGKGGQEFIIDVVEKIKLLQDKNILIGIDGGINSETIKNLKGYKVDIIISGSYICMSDNYNYRIEILKNECK